MEIGIFSGWFSIQMQTTIQRYFGTASAFAFNIQQQWEIVNNKV